jgi:4-aminobutyrate aminotransferase-like enzyme
MSPRVALRGDELPEIRVPPPGPKSRAASRRLRKVEGAAIWGAVGPAGPALGPIVWERAKGSVVLDLDGNRYLDLTSGFGAASLGHAAPEVARAVASQARRMAQGLGDLHPHAVREKLARRFSALGGSLSKVLFASTGSEAVELALKTAALFTGRRRVVAFEGGYHGQSGLALEATHAPASPGILHAGTEPRAVHLPFPDPYRCPLRRDCGGCDLACLDEAWKRVEWELRGPDPPGAILVEPIQGRAGVIIPPEGFLPALAARARAAGLLVIVDEVLTGGGRTGPFWAWERGGPSAEPDLMAVGKGIGGGVAIAALLGKPEIMDVWANVASASGEAPYASTFYAHPLACAGTLAALERLNAPELRARAETTARALAAGLASSIEGRRPGVTARSIGLLAAVEFVGDGASRPPAPERARSVLHALLGSGVLAIPGGVGGNVISLLPSFVITPEQLGEALIRFARAIDEADV